MYFFSSVSGVTSGGTSNSVVSTTGNAASAATPLLVGFSGGQIQLIDPVRKELSKLYNEEVSSCFLFQYQLVDRAQKKPPETRVFP